MVRGTWKGEGGGEKERGEKTRESKRTQLRDERRREMINNSMDGRKLGQRWRRILIKIDRFFFFKVVPKLDPVIVSSCVSSVIMIDVAERFAETRERKRRKKQSFRVQEARGINQHFLRRFEMKFHRIERNSDK